jgi:hypothetical protein
MKTSVTAVALVIGLVGPAHAQTTTPHEIISRSVHGLVKLRWPGSSGERGAVMDGAVHFSMLTSSLRGGARGSGVGADPIPPIF